MNSVLKQKLEALLEEIRADAGDAGLTHYSSDTGATVELENWESSWESSDWEDSGC